MFKKLVKNKKVNSIVSYTKSFDRPFSIIDEIHKKIKFNLLKFKDNRLTDFKRTQDWPTSISLAGSIKTSKLNFFNKFVKTNKEEFKSMPFDINSCIRQKILFTEASDINDLFDIKLARLINYDLSKLQ